MDGFRADESVESGLPHLLGVPSKKYGVHGSVAWAEERACLFTTHSKLT